MEKQEEKYDGASKGFLKGLSKKDKEERKRVMKRRTAMDDDDPKAYAKWRTDSKVPKKRPESPFNQKFKKMYGEQADLVEAKLREALSAKTEKAIGNKAKKSGMPKGILRQVYNRGLAAWKVGHKPGATQHAWAMAMVNSFTTKSPGTWGKADKDLAAKVRKKK